jgi:hypothetical protein
LRGIAVFRYPEKDGGRWAQYGPVPIMCGLTRDGLAFILDTFRIVRRKDEERYGEHPTKGKVLEGRERLGRDGITEPLRV